MVFKREIIAPETRGGCIAGFEPSGGLGITGCWGDMGQHTGRPLRSMDDLKMNSATPRVYLITLEENQENFI
jgi:hypothetical protein